MPQYQHPGLYIQEVPSIPTIQGASTSIPVFIGLTESKAKADVNVPRLITNWASFQRYFGGLVWGAYVPWAVSEFFAEGGGNCYVINIDDSDDTEGTGAQAGTTTSIDGWTINAASTGSWSNFIYVSVRDAGPVPPGGDQGDPKSSSFFSVSVMAKAKDIDDALTSGDASEIPAAQLIQAYISRNALDNITTDADQWYVLESFGAFTVKSLVVDDDGVSPLMAQINARSIFIRVAATGTVRPPNLFPPTTAFSGGTYVAQDYTNALSNLAAVQDVSLVATPDLVLEAANQKSLINDTLAACEQANMFYVVDPPFYVGPTATNDVLNFKIGGADVNDVALESAHGALYHPWVYVLNQAMGVNVPIPPSGPVLGRYAYTDNTIGVHKSPAGVRDGQLRTVTRLSIPVSQGDQDVLNPHGINAIRNLVNFGNTVYGARTLAVGTDYTYVAIRRFVTFVERSLNNGLQWVVFEPNSTVLWKTVTREVTGFLTVVWQQGALFGSTADEAFFVTCDETNNPSDLRAQGVLNVDVGLAVVYPAEFVVVRIAQKVAATDSGF